MQRLPRLLASCLAALVPAVAAGAPRPLLPDLVTVPPFDLKLDFKSRPGGRLLCFSNSTWNAGPGALVLRGEPVNGESRVTQRITASDGASSERFVGHFVFHPRHKHWHFEGYSRYELWALDAAGAPARQVALSAKVGYCIWDERRAPEKLAGAPRSRVHRWEDCRAARATQGLSVGWSDTYASNLDGQYLDVSGLADGRYALVSLTDPANVIREVDDANNVAATLLRLSGNKVIVERGLTRLRDLTAISPRPAAPLAVIPAAPGARPAAVAMASPVEYRVVSAAPLAGLSWPGTVQAGGDWLRVTADPELAWTLVGAEDAALSMPGDFALRFNAVLSGEGGPSASILLYGEAPPDRRQRSFLQLVLLGPDRWRAQYLDGATGDISTLFDYRGNGEIELRLRGVAAAGPERLQVLSGGRLLGEAALPGRLLASGSAAPSLRLGLQVQRGGSLALSGMVLLAL